MKIELKTAPKTFTEKEFIACFYDDENIFYEGLPEQYQKAIINKAVSYTHLRAHVTVIDLVCRLLLAKNKKKKTNILLLTPYYNTIY